MRIIQEIRALMRDVPRTQGLLRAIFDHRQRYDVLSGGIAVQHFSYIV